MLTFPQSEVEEFLRTYEIGLFSVSTDESRIAISTNLSGLYDVWMLDIPSTYPFPITNVGQKPERLMFDPLGRHLMVSFDDNGDENPQIYAVDLNGGKLVPIVQTSGKKFHLQAISMDGERIYYASDCTNTKFMNSYKKDLVTGEEQTILIGNEALTFITNVAPDESSFTYNSALSNTYMAGFVLKGKDTYSLTPNSSIPHRVRSPHYFDTDTIYFWTDYKKEYAYVAKFNLISKEFTEVFVADGEEVKDICIDQANGLLYAFTSSGVEDQLYQINLESMISVNIPMPISVVQNIQLMPSGNLYVSGVSETMPSNLFKRDFKNEEWIQLTQNRVMGVSPDQLTKAQKIVYSSFDKLEIEALLFEPQKEVANGFTII
jgi:hypothetical protein